MSDTFIKGLQRATARKKLQQQTGRAVATTDLAKQQTATLPVKPFARFDEILYQATIISKMISLINKRKGATQ